MYQTTKMLATRKTQKLMVTVMSKFLIIALIFNTCPNLQYILSQLVIAALRCYFVITVALICNS